MNPMYKVRFHVGAGVHFRHWQVEGPKGVEYYDPDKTSLVLRGCRLSNRKSVAEKVFSSQRRDVCGYAVCESVDVIKGVLPAEGQVVHFDPKIAPYWTVEGLDGPQDGIGIPTLYSSGRRLRIPSSLRGGFCVV